MTEIYINGQLVDTQDAQIALTLQAFTFGQLGTRRGSYSNVFSLARTNANKALFDNCEIVTSVTALPYQKNTCQIFIDGILVVDGSAVILETREEYRVFISAGNTDFFKAISSVKLVDVDLSEFDHLYDGTNVTARRETTEGFVYPNIDYGFFEYATPGLTSYSFRFFQPSFWGKTIIQKAVEALGYTLHGDLLNTLTYRNLAVLCRGAVADLSDSLAEYGFTIDYNQLTGDTFEKISFPNRIKDNSSLYGPDANAGHFTYQPNVADPDEVRFEISITGKVITNLPRYYTNAEVWVDLLIYNAAGTLLLTVSPTPVSFEDRFFGIFNVYRAPESGTLERDLNFIYPSRRDDVTAFNTLINGTADLTTLRFGWQVRSNRPGYGLKYLRFENLEFRINQVPKTGTRVSGPNIPITVRAANVLPASPTVGDLFLLMANLEGVIIQVDETTKRVNTARLDGIATRKAQALDWSGKIDLSEEPTVTYQLEGFAQLNFYDFAGDDKDPFLQPNEGRGVVTVINQNLEAEKVVFESKFAPVPVLPTLQASRTMGKVFTGDKYTFDGFNYNLNEDLKINDFAPRVAILTPTEASLDVQIGANAINYEVNAAALSFERALRDNYRILSNVLDNTKVVEALFILDLPDVQRLDFTRPVYVEKFGDYFYIEQVRQFKVNRRESCFVRLVKLGI
jgi:hypothetical protein